MIIHAYINLSIDFPLVWERINDKVDVSAPSNSVWNSLPAQKHQSAAAAAVLLGHMRLCDFCCLHKMYQCFPQDFQVRLQGKILTPRQTHGRMSAFCGMQLQWEDMATGPLWLSYLLPKALQEGGVRHKMVWSDPGGRRFACPRKFFVQRPSHDEGGWPHFTKPVALTEQASNSHIHDVLLSVKQ